MNASAQAVGEQNRGGAAAGYALRSSRPTRPVYGSARDNQVVSELTETLRRIMASATALLGVRTC